MESDIASCGIHPKYNSRAANLLTEKNVRQGRERIAGHHRARLTLVRFHSIPSPRDGFRPPAVHLQRVLFRAKQMLTVAASVWSYVGDGVGTTGRPERILSSWPKREKVLV